MDHIYQQMWTTAFPNIKEGLIHTDDQISNKADNRRGITLLIRPSKTVISNLLKFLQQAQIIAPNQYYYPASDLHITALSIFSCRANFNLKSIDLSTYQQLIRQTLKDFPPFQINYDGITVSSTSVVAKGYDLSGRLNEIRTALRKVFRQTTLANSIDKRYVLKAAHSTLIRFKNPLKKPKAFANFLAQHQNTPFGTTTVETIDLVFNDWYMQTDNVDLLEHYPLKSRQD